MLSAAGYWLWLLTCQAWYRLLLSQSLAAKGYGKELAADEHRKRQIAPLPEELRGPFEIEIRVQQHTGQQLLMKGIYGVPSQGMGQTVQGAICFFYVHPRQFFRRQVNEFIPTRRCRLVCC
jgi:hypothetical protein